MARKKKLDPWDDLADEQGRAEVLEQIPQKGWTKFLKPYMWFAVVSLPVLMVASIFTISNMSTEIEDMRDVIANQKLDASSPGRALATETVRKWLAQEPSPLPGGYLVSWDGATKVPFNTRINDNNQDVSAKDLYDAEVNNFTLADSNNQLWTASLLMKIDKRDGSATPYGGPSLAYKAPASSDGWDDGSPWPGINSEVDVIGDSVKTAVAAWAKAYASGDPAQLRQVTGDEDSSHAYIPLYNVADITTEVEDGAPLEWGKTDTVIANVQMAITWQNQPTVENSETTIPVSMDVLVERADTGSPVVVAWGPSGTGPTLQKFGNAIASREVDAPPSPSASESVATQPSNKPAAPAPSPTTSETP